MQGKLSRFESLFPLAKLDEQTAQFNSLLLIQPMLSPKRLQRLHGRPVLVMQNGTTESVRQYLGELGYVAGFTFIDVPIAALFPTIPNQYFVHPHTDKWPLFNNDYSLRARGWLAKIAGQREPAK